MTELMRVKHNDVAYWSELLEAANTAKNLTDAAMARMAARILRIERNLYGKRLNDDAKTKLMKDAYKYLENRGFSGRASRRGDVFRDRKDYFAQKRRERIGAPWYWNLSSVRSKGIGEGGGDRAKLNAAYRSALTKVMKDFANDWAAKGNNIPIHGFF